jgi:L-idonate 5-dehydrogenase
MDAWVLHGMQDVRLEQRPDPRPTDHEVLIRVERVGICGSDIHYYRHGRVGAFVPTRPFVLGHEVAGEVVAVGRDAGSIVVGDRVAVDPSQACLRCAWCRRGRSNLCPQMRYFGSAATDPPTDGALCDLKTAAAANCYRLGDRLSYAEGALLEPLAVACHAVLRAGSIAGAVVAVSGGGTIGQLIATVARALGAARVVVSDPREAARETAAARADAVLDPGDPDAVGREWARGGAPEVAFEAAGAEASFLWALQHTASGGAVVQVGTLPQAFTAPFNQVMTRELRVVGSFRFAGSFRVGADLLAARRIEVESLISGVLPISQTHAALHRASTDAAAIKLHVSRT